MIQRRQAHWESATPKCSIDRDNSGCCLDGKDRGHKLSFMCFLFPVRTSLCSSPCTCCILVVPVTSPAWSGSQCPLSCTRHGLSWCCQQCFVLDFWSLLFWSRYLWLVPFQFWRSHPWFCPLPSQSQTNVSSDFFKSICVLPVRRANRILIFTWFYWDAEGQNMPSLLAQC